MATQYMKVLASLVVAAGAAALAVSGCELIASVDRTEISNGGSAPVGGSGGTGGVAGQGGGGGPACDPLQCPGTDTDCAVRICNVNDACAVSNTASGAACDDAPPDGKVCDGAGTCVECVDNTQCTAPNDLCDTNAHICVPPTCQNSALDPGETDIDCGGPTCGNCANTKFCNDATDCQSAYCDTSAGGGQGGSGAAGVCTACANDGQCLAAEWCNTAVAGGTCQADKALGDACGGPGQCTSGFCPAQDGVCCDAACGSTCQACLGTKTGGANGTCALVTAQTDPDTECADQGAASCGSNGTGCTGNATACRLYSAVTVCSAETCTGNTDSPADLCNGTGTCVNSANVTCANNLNCNAGGTACLTTCSVDGNCVSGFYCAAPNCAAKKADGASCGGSNECTNGNCVDGVCCNTACGGACDACTAALKGSGVDGVCGNTAAGGTGSPSCTPYVCTGTGTTCPVGCVTDAQCASGNYCNGSLVCVPKLANGNVCGGNNECTSNNCIDGFCCNNACNGGCNACDVAGSEGTCTNVGAGQPGEPSCTPYVCSAGVGTCPTSCTDDTNCISGDYCDASNVCVPKLANGGTCTGTNQCTSGNCVDSVCCNTACGGLCQACSAAKTGGANGTCADVANDTDPDAECAAPTCCQTGATCGGTACP